MPSMSLSHKLKLFSNFIKARRFREIYNMFWVYPLWWNHKMSSFLLNKLFPKFGIDLFPPFLEIEPTTVCNFRCKICERTYWKEPSESMSFSDFKKVFDDFGRPKWIGLTGIGSGYLNKDYHKMMAYIKSRGTIIEIFDHFGNFRDDNQIKELIEIGPDFQFVSIYGGTKKTSEYICKGSNFDNVVKNIKTFVRLKKQMKKRFPILSFHFIVTKQSKDELFGFVDFIASLNTEVGEVLITPLLHGFKHAKGFQVKVDEAYRKKIINYAHSKGLPVTFNQCSEEEKSDITNCKQYIMPFVFVGGNVTPCCGQNENNQRTWQHENSLGNALKTPFRKIWYSEKYVNLRKQIRQNKCPKECANCPVYVGRG
ncbi:hypothetical protein CMI39_00775 [Candidatus Pacearchaeota archaeon]|nr:hypothetical protein [Candidatus Pacearchaeota archaeon]